jgi:hypothetical protein
LFGSWWCVEARKIRFVQIIASGVGVEIAVSRKPAVKSLIV